MIDQLPINMNVSIELIDREGRVVDQRTSHNVLTNTGREWLARLVGASAFTDPSAPTPHTPHRVMYMGFGCGGVLQTGTDFARSQSALVGVTALEDPVPFRPVDPADVANLANTSFYYLKRVDAQTVADTYFPAPFRTRFITTIAETEISFTASRAFRSQTLVGTEVMISEAGLYLSSADPALTDPTQQNSLIAYDVFDPMPVTPLVSMRTRWEFRF